MSVMSRPRTDAPLEEIEAIYRRDLRKLKRLATAITGSREAGCDAVQDAFARAVHRRGRFRREGTLEGWLWRIVISTARDTAVHTHSTHSPLENADFDAVVDEGERAALRDVIACLPERQRLVLGSPERAELPGPACPSMVS